MSFFEYFLPVISYLELPLSARLSYFAYAQEFPAHLIKKWDLILFIWIRTFLINVPILYSLKTTGNLWLSDVFGGMGQKEFTNK